jgi:hypothetical protein
MKWRKENPVQYERVRRNTRYKRVYGISLDDYENMVNLQNGECLICREVPNRLVVDHDHSTGMVRGLLCDPCNTGIGMFMDNEDRLLAAAEYVKD